MGRFDYQVVKHEQYGWAYRLDQTYSRVFPTQMQAIAAAKEAAVQMHEEGDQTLVRVREGPLNWRTEFSISDSPQPVVLYAPA